VTTDLRNHGEGVVVGWGDSHQWTYTLSGDEADLTWTQTITTASGVAVEWGMSRDGDTITATLTAAAASTIPYGSHTLILRGTGEGVQESFYSRWVVA